MSRNIVWEDCGVRAYVDGSEIAILFASGFTLSDQFNVDRARFQGSNQPDLDATYNGASGTVDFKLKKGYGDPADVTDLYKAAVKNRASEGEIRLVVSHNSTDGTTREAYSLSNVHPSSTLRGSEDTPLGVTWNWEASNSEHIKG